MSNDFLPGQAGDELPGQSGGEVGLPSPVPGLYVLPTPALWPDYCAVWWNGSPCLVVSVTDDGVPLVIRVVDSPEYGTASQIVASGAGDLTGAGVTLTVWIFACNSGTVTSYAGTAIDFETGECTLTSVQAMALGSGFFRVALQVSYPAGPAPVFRSQDFSQMILQLVVAA